MSDWFQLDKEYMMSTYCRTKLAIERGAGCKLIKLMFTLFAKEKRERRKT